MLYLDYDQINKLKMFDENILTECIEELEMLDWAISQTDERGITQYEIDRTFEFYLALGEEKYGYKD